MSRRDWTEGELDILRSTAHLVSWDVAEILGRSNSSVVRRRSRLSETEGITWGIGSQKEPCAVGLRRLVAKTCIHCGELMDARWFRRNQIAGCWSSKCQACCRPRGDAEKAATRLRNRRSKSSMRRSVERFQAATMPAAKAGQEWTGPDHEVLANPDLTVLEKALQLRRTYKATLVALSRGGYTSRVGLGDAEQGRWVIDFAEQVSA